MLGDATRLAGDDVGVADVVEQRGLAVVDVAHHGDDRGARLQVGVVLLVVVAEQRLQLELGLLAGLDEQHLGAERLGDELDHLVGQRLRAGDHLARVEQQAHEVGRGAVQLGRELLDGAAALDDDLALGHRRVGRRELRQRRGTEVLEVATTTLLAPGPLALRAGTTASGGTTTGTATGTTTATAGTATGTTAGTLEATAATTGTAAGTLEATAATATTAGTLEAAATAAATADGAAGSARAGDRRGAGRGRDATTAGRRRDRTSGRAARRGRRRGGRGRSCGSGRRARPRVRRQELPPRARPEPRRRRARAGRSAQARVPRRRPDARPEPAREPAQVRARAQPRARDGAAAAARRARSGITPVERTTRCGAGAGAGVGAASSSAHGSGRGRFGAPRGTPGSPGRLGLGLGAPRPRFGSGSGSSTIGSRRSPSESASAADAVRGGVVDARRVALDADLQPLGEIEHHLVLDAELSRQLVDPDLLRSQARCLCFLYSCYTLRPVRSRSVPVTGSSPRTVSRVGARSRHPDRGAQRPVDRPPALRLVEARSRVVPAEPGTPPRSRPELQPGGRGCGRHGRAPTPLRPRPAGTRCRCGRVATARRR